MLIAMLMVLSIVPAQEFAVETRAEKLAGSGTADDPYQIATAQQFDSIRNDLTAHYILTQDIDLSSVVDFQPIGAVTFADADEDGNMKAEKAFTGTLDGNGKTISNVTVKDNGNLIGVGIFGVTMNQASITDLTLCNVTSTGSKALATGGLVGYGMSQGGVKNIKLTASTGKTNTITGTNCVGGIVGGSGSPIVDCYAEKTTINLFGDNTTGDNNFSEGRLVQHDVAECGAAIVGGTVYGQEAVDKYEKNPDATAFDCQFTQNIVNLTFNGTEITGTDASGKQVFRHAYKCIGNYNIGEEIGRDDFGGFVMQSLDNNEDEFKYFLILPDTPDSTYHIEFRYGSDLDALQKYSSGKYAYWLAAGIPTSAMHETSNDIGKNDSTLRNVIALFCTENLSQMAGGQTAAQRTELVGTWDASDETIAALRKETGKSKATMYMQLGADGFGATYVDLEGNGSYVKAKDYTFYAYDNDGSDKKQSGVYLAAMDDTTSSSPYTLTTKNNKTVLSLYAADGTASWIKRSEPFTDVPRDAYYADAVRWASNQGVTAGTSPTTFSPNDACTRAQVVTFLYNEAGKPEAKGDNPFVDVTSKDYYHASVIWAAENGITAGTSKTTFSPNDTCTRAQVVSFLYRDKK